MRNTQPERNETSSLNKRSENVSLGRWRSVAEFLSDANTILDLNDTKVKKALGIDERSASDAIAEYQGGLDAAWEKLAETAKRAAANRQGGATTFLR